MSIKATQPALTDEQIDSVFIKYAGVNDFNAAYFTGYVETFRHAVRDVLALATPSPQPAEAVQAEPSNAPAMFAMGRICSFLAGKLSKAEWQECAPDIHNVCRAIESAKAEPAEAKTAAERIRHAGAMLSNCAFNMAQRKPGKPLTDSDIRALDESRKAWDAAIATQEGGHD